MNKPKYLTRTFSAARVGGGTRGSTRGAAAVEFAVLLIPLLLLTFGVAEYGRALYEYNTLVKTVRDSARLLSQQIPADAASYSLALDDARCLAVHGNAGCTGPALAPGLTTDMVDIATTTMATAAGTAITLVDVRITGYQFNFVFNPARLLGNATDTFSFSDIHATMRQQ